MALPILVSEGTDFQILVWRLVPFVMPSMYGYQSLQSIHEKNLLQFLPSAIFDSMYIVKRKFLKKYATFFAISFFDSKYIVKTKSFRKSLPRFLQSAFSYPKYLV